MQPYFRYVFYGPKQKKKLQTNKCPWMFCVSRARISDEMDIMCNSRRLPAKVVVCLLVYCTNLKVAGTVHYPKAIGTGV